MLRRGQTGNRCAARSSRTRSSSAVVLVASSGVSRLDERLITSRTASSPGGGYSMGPGFSDTLIDPEKDDPPLGKPVGKDFQQPANHGRAINGRSAGGNDLGAGILMIPAPQSDCTTGSGNPSTLEIRSKRPRRQTSGQWAIWARDVDNRRRQNGSTRNDAPRLNGTFDGRQRDDPHRSKDRCAADRKLLTHFDRKRLRATRSIASTRRAGWVAKQVLTRKSTGRTGSTMDKGFAGLTGRPIRV